MTITYALVAPSAVDTDLKLTSLPDLTDFSVVTSDESSVQANLQSGDNQAPIVFRAGRRYNRNTGRMYDNMSLQVAVKKTESLTDKVTYQPLTAGLSWNFDGEHLVSTAYATQVISMLVAIFAQELTAANGYPTSKIVEYFEAGQLREIVG